MKSKYFKIGKSKHQYIVYKISEYNGRKSYKEYFFTNKLSDAINFCKSRNYNLKGLLIWIN